MAKQRPAAPSAQQPQPETRKSFFGKLWWFLWEDNSVWSWIANILVAFVLIKFVIYPGLGLLLGTGYPIVAVVSSSMEHDSGFDDWWQNGRGSDAYCASRAPATQHYAHYGISKEDFATYPFVNGFDKGDIMILRGPTELAIGDVLTFWADGRNEPIIHRIVRVREQPDGSKIYMTKGDNNCGSANFEQGIQANQMVGKAAFRIPFLGWVKIGFVELLKVVGVMQ
jgi:hypothetical protein